MTGNKIHQWIGVSLFLILLGLLVSTQAPRVHAASIVVNDLSDSLTLGSCSTTGTGTCTLREAITYANTNAGADTIYFSVDGTINLIFTLTKSTEDLTIDGTGHTITINGGDTHLTMQSNAGAPLTLKYLTLTNSYNSGSGGAIAADDTLNLDHVTAQDSMADGFGGGVYAKGAATISNSTFSGNYALSGGGAFFDGTADLGNSSFTHNNTTEPGNSASGGGAYFNNTATLTNVIFDNNTAGSGPNTSGAGGAAFALGATITGGAFKNNTGNFAGGGAYFAGTATIDGTTFFNNTAKTDRGGGAYFDGPAIVQNALFNGNSSSADIGGGAYFRKIADVNATSFITNTAGDRAGGAYFYATAILTDTDFYTNTGTVFGGGAYFAAPTSILNGVLQGNTCSSSCSGGGAYMDSTSVITGTHILTNTADSSGGGLAANNSMGLTGATLQGNESTGGYGGGAAVLTGVFVVSRTLILDNKANATDFGGGGIASSGYTGIFTSTLHGNQGYGGGAIANAGLVSLFDSTVDHNTAYGGGGIYNQGAGLVVGFGSTLTGNEATLSGGGIYSEQTGGVQLYNVTLAENTAATGGGVYFDTTSGQAAHPSRVNLPKSADTPDLAQIRNLPGMDRLPKLPSANTSLALVDTILGNNTNGDCVADTLIVDATNSLISDGLTCVSGTNTNNLTGDPQLNALADNGGPTETMALKSFSPAIDSADQTGCFLLQPTDQRGELRDDLQCDMGAYELKFADSPSVTRYDHPVGTPQTYGPTLAKITLASGTLADLTILLTKGAPANTPPPNNALPLNWDLSNVCQFCGASDAPQKPSAFSLDATFCFDPSALSTQDPNKLHVWHYNGSTWDDIGGTLDDTTYPNYYCVAATTPITTLSPFIVAPAAPTSTDVTGVRGIVNARGNVVVRWKTVSEERIAGFNLYRQTKAGAWKQINLTQRAAKHAGTALSDKYRFTDRSVKAGKTYRYKVQIVYLDNHTEWSDIIKVKTP